MNEERNCKTHGLTNFRMVGRNEHKRMRCLLCLSEAVIRRRKKIKDLALEYMGNVCQTCGYSKCKAALEFHHKEDFEKEFAIGAKGYTRSWEKVKKELDKCILLCSNCHREVHNS